VIDLMEWIARRARRASRDLSRIIGPSDWSAAGWSGVTYARPRAAVVSWQLNANQFSSGNDAKSLDSGRGSTRFGGEGSYCRREKM
jgi:hypothetical protein